MDEAGRDPKKRVLDFTRQNVQLSSTKNDDTDNEPLTSQLSDETCQSRQSGASTEFDINTCCTTTEAVSAEVHRRRLIGARGA